jgi:hypothetical protein
MVNPMGSSSRSIIFITSGLVWRAGMENMHGRIGYLSGFGI